MWRLCAVLTLVVLVAGGCVPRPPGGISQAPAATPPRLETIAQRRAAFAEAYTHWRRGAEDLALPTFTALADGYPELADYALYYVGAIASGRADNATAESAFARLLRDYPESVKAPAAALGIGKLLLHAGRVEEARRNLQVALTAPDAATTYGARLALAEADERVGSLDTAYVEYMVVRRQMPGSSLGR